MTRTTQPRYVTTGATRSIPVRTVVDPAASPLRPSSAPAAIDAIRRREDSCTDIGLEGSDDLFWTPATVEPTGLDPSDPTAHAADQVHRVADEDDAP